MFKLRQTWPPYFSSAVLHNLDTRTHYIDPAWPITARVADGTPSAPTIHANPDFIQRVSTARYFTDHHTRACRSPAESTEQARG